MALKDVDQPTIQAPDDVIIKVVRTCVCGSDLWFYRGIDEVNPHAENSGHEAIGIVDSVGKDIKSGDFIIAPFTHGCGHCAACRAGYDNPCLTNGGVFSSGVQAEYFRFQHSQWALIKIPGQPDDYSEGMKKALLALADVMATGYHAARVAHVGTGDTEVVMGDGAVGLCAIIAAQMRGAKRIISTSRPADRLALAKKFGATDNVAVRGDEAVKAIMDLTDGDGADAVLECVGSKQSMDTAMKVGRPGATVGRIGVPHDAQIDMNAVFFKDIAVTGGSASVTTYDKQFLLKLVLDGEINPDKIFTADFTLDQIQDAYQAKDQRTAIKSYIKVN